MKSLVDLIAQDAIRITVLSIVRDLNLPDCYVAAGFLRNLVWDDLHGIQTELTDIDVVFFDESDVDSELSQSITQQLNLTYPSFQWDVKNQAHMHFKNGDEPYTSTLDAMSYWPEKETAIGAMLNDDESISVVTAFDLEELFKGNITYNPKRSKDTFYNRVKSKHWLETWPHLKVKI